MSGVGLPSAGAALPTEVDFLVIGAGLLGLCTAWQLQRRGREVLVLERANVGHAGSGSKGLCRIFRLGYDDPRYVAMARAALPMWRGLEQETGSSLLETTGQLTFGSDIEVLSAGLSEAGAPWEPWTAEQVEHQFPDVVAPGPAVFEPSSGVIHAERTLLGLRTCLGPALREGVEVGGIIDSHGAVRVDTSAGRVAASRVICCAGPWTPALMSGAGVDVDLHASAEQVAYFAPTDGTRRALPVLIERGHPMAYGLPVPESTWFKMGRHQSAARIWLGEAQLDPPAPASGEDILLGADLTRLVPGFDPEPVFSECCFYDNSPDDDFVLDRVGRITIGAGTSGHGFKFGPLLGEVLADLAEGTPPRLPVDWLALRPRPQESGT